MQPAKQRHWLVKRVGIGLMVLAAGFIIASSVGFWQLNLWSTTIGRTAVETVGSRLTRIEVVDFECRAMARTAFVQQGFKAENSTRIGVGNLGFNFGHHDAMAAFLGVVGEFELCVHPQDQSIEVVGDELRVSVNRIIVNRPALDLGQPNEQQVPDCGEVVNQDGTLNQELINANPATFEQTHYLCVSKELLATTASYTTFLQNLERHAEANVSASRCLQDGLTAIKALIERHYERQAGLQELVLMAELDGLVIQPIMPAVSATEGTSFAQTTTETCLSD